MTAAARSHAPDLPIEAVVVKFGLRLRRQGRELVGPCPRCGGRDRFAVNPSKQLWNCRGCARGGDAIDLVRHVDGCSYREAVGVLGGEGNNKRVAPAARDDDRWSLDFAEQIWGQTTQLAPEAMAYFARRGIPIDEVPDHGGLRWHPSCQWEGGTKPCVIGRYTTAVDNERRGIWRRPIDGTKPKALGSTAGCVIRLWPDDAVETALVLGEGVETTLAAATRIEHRGALLHPAWAAGSAANMQSFPVLVGVECLTQLADNDTNGVGERAAEECAQRWLAAGKDVELLIPNKAGVDFNDVTIERVSQ
jgi:phage/plasmid primase-like uncharacterized protein